MSFICVLNSLAFTGFLVITMVNTLRKHSYLFLIDWILPQRWVIIWLEAVSLLSITAGFEHYHYAFSQSLANGLQQIGWVTLDNASNNDTFMASLERELTARGILFDRVENRIRYVWDQFQITLSLITSVGASHMSSISHVRLWLKPSTVSTMQMTSSMPPTQIL